LAVSAALAVAVGKNIGQLPTDLYGIAASVCREAFAGILLGSFVNLSLQALQIAGSFMDLQAGLGSSHVLNPLNGVQSTVLSQLKSMLGIVVFLSADGHHMLLRAFVQSYHAMPTFGQVEVSFTTMITAMFMIALQIASPVMAVGFLVDAALALMTRAVPQMNAMHTGMPAKIGAGIAAVSLGLPLTVAGVGTAMNEGFGLLRKLFNY
jgi:flagellar biosynthetic protein FliR